MKTKRKYREYRKISGLPVKLPLMALAVLLASTFFTAAQVTLSTSPERTQTRNGNKQYNDENYTEAETSYKKALDIKNNMPEATFNLGDALYKQKRYDDAGKQFQLSAQNNAEPKLKANGWYNLGNSYMEQKKWEDAIKAYKNALKINPNDADSRYNLAYANEMMRKNKGGGGKNQDKKDEKDKKDDKKDNKDQKQDKKDDQKQDKQNQDKQANNQDQKNKQQQGQKSKLSKEETEKLLQALNDEEQKTTQKMLLKQMKTQKIKIQKDW
jgi:Ca-activated chloride channel homolog